MGKRLLPIVLLPVGCGDDSLPSLDAATSDAGATDGSRVADGAMGSDARTEAFTAGDAGPVDAAPDGGSSIIDDLLSRLADPSLAAAGADALFVDRAWSHGWPVREATAGV